MTRKRELTEEQLEAKRLKSREYNARPEVKARRAEYYRQPEVQARYKARIARGDQIEYMRQWRQSDNGKRKLKDSGLRQRGFTLELLEMLLSLQNNSCAICRRPFPENYREIHADHCHDNNLPRGLLCQACNHAEGQIKKTGLTPEEFGRRLTAYLGNPPAARVGSVPKSQDILEKGNCHDIR